MDNKTKVLFICQHNSGRSQIAEAFMRSLYGDHFEIESAGLEPAAVSGTDAEKLEKVREIRDTIRDWLLHPPKNSINFKALIDS